MGEAKRKADQQRAEIRAMMEKWAGPDIPGEADIASQIEALPSEWVNRADRAQLEWAGMKVGDCHANCIWYERNDPRGDHKRVTGWIVDDVNGVYMLHSIVKRGDEAICITPTLDGTDGCTFRADPDVIMTEEDGRIVFHRKGTRIGVGIRRDVEATRKKSAQIIAALEAGASIQDLMRL
ncbi:hypothetical protein [Caulobacter endophyticus]|uniref:hypothetical protein n=1 Tax=Caulobacter endophyticus TaxID=2172652 RepID=UPI0024109B00|nr:hypothetical protein [Caulobacter endophyticus]MDG2531280.1 hypothetical protein [Caulobacter endophyticus]